MTIQEILKKDSGLYGATVDGREAVIGRDVGKGFTISLQEKPGWYRINHYNEQGEFEYTDFKRDKEVAEYERPYR